jgi:hypothetical protein
VTYVGKVDELVHVVRVFVHEYYYFCFYNKPNVIIFETKCSGKAVYIFLLSLENSSKNTGNIDTNTRRAIFFLYSYNNH